MIILGLILLLVGWFTLRPLAYVGVVVLVIGLVLLFADVASPYGPAWY